MSTPVLYFPLRISIADDFKWLTDFEMELDPENRNVGIRNSIFKGERKPPYQVPYSFLKPFPNFYTH